MDQIRLAGGNPFRFGASNVNFQIPVAGAGFEPQFIAGYALREGSKVTVTVDGRPFSFFTKDNSAWTDNAAEDPALVAAMKAGARMVVEATSRRGTDTTYEYSLSGVTAALDAIGSCQ